MQYILIRLDEKIWIANLAPFLDEQLQNEITQNDEDAKYDRKQRGVGPPKCLSVEAER